jgi:hypothetical protein
MAYESEHASAVADIRAAGAPVTFTREKPGEYDAATDSWTEPMDWASADGWAMQVAGDPRQYERLGLVEIEAPTLMFAAERFGVAPGLGDAVTWADRRMTVKSVLPFAPAGVAIFAYVVVA